MSVSVLGNPIEYSVKYECPDPIELLEKCGEVFLERQLGSLIYLCTLCDDQFQDVEVFSKHIADVHLSIESFITYEPNESDEDDLEETESLLEPIKEESGDESLINNEEIYNIIDSSKTVLDIQVYLDEQQLDSEVKVEEPKVVEADLPPDLPEGEANNLADEPDAVEEARDKFPSESQSHVQGDEADVDDPCENPVYPLAESQNHILDDAADPSDEDILRSKLKCKFCGDQFEYVRDLRQHDCGVRKGTRFYDCSECGKVFKKKSGRDIHMMIHKGEKPHKCDICGSAYACKQNLIVHVRRHTGEKPFKCNFCDRRFASSTEKKSHMRTHTGERPFICELCGKAHTSSSQLTEHMHRHLDIRNYACQICDKRFRNSYNLRMHQLTHGDGPRQHNCTHCLASFKTQNNLRQHVKIHMEVKKYVCKICGRAFAQHPGLYSHMKSHAISK